MRYNCCQQEGLCPQNRTCKPLNSQRQPWKRFTCECPDGYLGDNCEQPIKSCQGYARGSRVPGRYQILGSQGYLQQVYCHFDAHGAWTLVQSYTFGNGSVDAEVQEFKLPIRDNHPVHKDLPTWPGYRLSRSRMKSIQRNSVFLLFTCDYEKHRDFDKSDYLRIPLKLENGSVINMFQLTNGYTRISNHDGKIGGIPSKNCSIMLSHYDGWPLHVHISDDMPECKLPQLASNTSRCYRWDGDYFHYFGGYLTNCFDASHVCVQKNNSTTQLWFGHI